MHKSADAFRTISEVADDLSLPQHVLRFWETRFPQVRPLKRAGGRRYYRPADVLLLKTIRQLLYDDGYTIKGVQRLIKEQGARGLGTAAPAIIPGLAEEGDPGIGEPREFGVPEIGDAGDEAIVELAAAPDIEGPPSSVPDRSALVEVWAELEECRRLLGSLRRL